MARKWIIWIREKLRYLPGFVYLFRQWFSTSLGRAFGWTDELGLFEGADEGYFDGSAIFVDGRHSDLLGRRCENNWRKRKIIWNVCGVSLCQYWLVYFLLIEVYFLGEDVH